MAPSASLFSFFCHNYLLFRKILLIQWQLRDDAISAVRGRLPPPWPITKLSTFLIASSVYPVIQ